MPDDTPADRLEQLTFPEQLCVWAIRSWVRGHTTGVGVHGLLAEAFELSGAPDAAAHFDGVMSIVATGARLGVEVRCVCCATVSADELRLLSAVAAWQATADGAWADRVLSDFLTASAVRAMHRPMAAFAQALMAARLPVRRQPERPREIVALSVAAAMASSAATLH